ncbi:hypothetical protein Trydic_g11492 [Trypoxylus dichotomus]
MEAKPYTAKFWQMTTGKYIKSVDLDDIPKMDVRNTLRCTQCMYSQRRATVNTINVGFRAERHFTLE